MWVSALALARNCLYDERMNAYQRFLDTIDIQRCVPDELDTLTAVAARAFWNDPMANYFFPNLLEQHAQAHEFYRSEIEDALDRGEVWAAYENGFPVALVCWLPPGVFPAQGLRALVRFAKLMPTILKTSHPAKGAELLSAIQQDHPTDRHYYVSLLATDPLRQGKGLGKELLRPILERCNQEGFDCYLETQKESNVAYYENQGFLTKDRFDVGSDSPEITTLVYKAGSSRPPNSI
jgi:GNAT superfamily N-acetyltransferase